MAAKAVSVMCPLFPRRPVKSDDIPRFLHVLFKSGLKSLGGDKSFVFKLLSG